MKRARNVAIAAAMAGMVAAPAIAADYSSTVFFGDSLTDSGTFQPLLPSGGKFTTNPGPVWAENLAGALGTSAVTAVRGGTDYAMGGARVATSVGYPPTGLTALAPSVAAQIAGYLATSGGRADPRALYTVWGGANDIFTALGNPATAQAVVTQAATDLVTQVARLRAAGATTILVPTVPDIGSTPFGRSQGPAASAQITQLVGGYNQLVTLGLANAGISVIPIDTFSLLRAAVADPAAFGFANVTSPACTTSTSLLCTPATLVAPGAAASHLFADGVHPTTAGHRAVSDFVLNALTAPGNVAQLAESPLHTRDRLTATILAQAATSLWSRKAGEAGAWISGGVGRLTADGVGDLGAGGQAGVRGTPYSVSIGVDKRFGENLLLGVAGTASRYRGNFSTGGDYRQREYVLSGYGVYRAGGAFVSGVGSFGFADYDLRRGVTINGTDHSTDGETEGINASIGVEGGYDFTTGGLTHGPVLGLRYQHVNVEGFSEDDSLFGFGYRSQTRNSLVGSVGYQAAYDLGRVLPYAKVTLNREFRDGTRSITVENRSISTLAYDVAVARPDRSYVDMTAGASFRLADAVTGTLGLNARAGERDRRDYGGFVGLNVGF
ncbi:autotransporter domain-containing protein [Azospirillum picis]|uniref:Outer membrane lipase/esterase n=1 Tax=Azospirillum picis TaxID=488438 RepID=A0ABU0MV98_9PROT|nr:autotransporter domain-containing protein [Azospirillum picis]MBP2303460.1 outer membrane lipase/esterase [Azospirillum picis]MDQ0537351.1 outer membrane lipase/esterase [Azospirillum picis]